MKRYYIASALENAAVVRRLHRSMAAMGWTCTYDWTGHGSVQHRGHAVIAEVATQEADGVAAADVVIVVMPGGRGTHTELGMALALQRPVVLVGAKNVITTASAQVCAFYLHPGVVRPVHADIAVPKQRRWLERKLPAEAARALRVVPPREPMPEVAMVATDLALLHPGSTWDYGDDTVTGSGLLLGEIVMRRRGNRYVATGAGYEAVAAEHVMALVALLAMVSAGTGGERNKGKARAALRLHSVPKQRSRK